LSWTPSQRQTVWAAVSRAVRTPARTQQDIRFNYQAFPSANGTPVIVAAIGSANATSEVLRAYELGYRVQPARKLSLDIATFYNIYNRLNSYEQGLPFFETDPLPAHLVVPVYYDNLLRGNTYGAEASANFDINSHWKLQGSYSFLHMQLQRDAASKDTASERSEGYSPRHQAQLHSYLKLSRNFELDTAIYRVSRLRGQQIPAYTRLDARFGWHVRESLELSLGLQNLLDNRHPEFNGIDAGVITSQVRRSIYGKVTWKF
jgi:iron complex outermembrane receptor protein